MMKSRHLLWIVFGCSTLAGCGAGSSATCVLAGTVVAVSRTNGSGACPAAVVAGVTALNATETFTPMKALACGVVKLKLNIDFSPQGANQTTCMGADALSFSDFQADGGSGTSTIGITCSDSTSCTETFDVTCTPQ